MSDDTINVMEMAHKAVAFEESLTFFRQYLYKTRRLDIIHLAHLADSDSKCWWVCDISAKSGRCVYEGITLVECLEWALEQPETVVSNE